jgi:serine/threonine protein kinase
MARRKLDVGDQPIAGYQLVEFLGQGNFGVVWKAVDTESGIFVAIKMIDLSRSPSARKELKGLNLVRNLRHPNLIPIYTARLKDKDGHELPLHKAQEVQEKDQLSELVIAMGLGEQNLSSRLKEVNPPDTPPAELRGLPLEEVLGYVQGAAKGIDFLNKADHGIGAGDGPIIHCDIKPDNMMLVSGEVQLADCGVAVLVTPDARQTKAAFSLAYSAPELTGNKPMPGTDQYALAISYFELRTGGLPFDRAIGQLGLMLAHAEGSLDFAHPALSPGETQVLKWATSPQPKSRYPSCREMVKQLERAAAGLDPVSPAGVVPSKSGSVAIPHQPPRRVPEKPAPLAGTQPPAVGLEVSSAAIILDVPPDDALFETHIPNVGTDPRETPVAEGKTQTPASGIDVGPYNKTLTGPDVSLPVADEKPAKVDRPKLNREADDPAGPLLGTVALGDELQAILRGEQPPKPSPPPTVPVAVTPPPRPSPPVTPSHHKTKSFPVVEEEESTLPSPKWRSKPNISPPADPRPTSPPLPVKPPAPPRKAGLGLPAKVLIGGLLAGGVTFGALAVFKPFSDRPPEKKIDETKTTVPPPPPPPVDDDFKILDTVPADRFQETVNELSKKQLAPEQQQKLARKLIEIGKAAPDRRAFVTDVLTADRKFADRVPDAGSRSEVVGWHVPKLEANEYAAATSAMQKVGVAATAENVEAAKKRVGELRAAADALGERFGRTELPAKVRTFLAAADVWAAARSGEKPNLTAYAALFKTEADVPLPGPFAVELMRLGTKHATPVADLRSLRDRTKAWTTIPAAEKQQLQDLFQEALAVHVRDALTANEPNLELLRQACGEDDAQGWVRLAAAEQTTARPDAPAANRLLDEAEKFPATESTAADKKAFVSFLRAVSEKGEASAEKLFELYQKPPKILTTPARQARAATALAAPVLQMKLQDKTSEDLLGEKSNPYPKDVKALGWLKKADELNGKDHKEWAIPLALLAAACGDRPTVRAVTGMRTLDPAKVLDEDLPLAAAFLRLQAQDSELPDEDRATAAAAFARVGFRIVEKSFTGYEKQRDVHALERKLLPKIDAVVEDALPRAPMGSGDALALRVARVRSQVALDALAADRQTALAAELTFLINQMAGQHPDKADAHAFRAYVAIQGFNAYSDGSGKPVGNLVAAPEDDRVKAWQQISQDAAAALRLDPANRVAHTITAYQVAAEFDALPPFAAPKAARKADFVANEPRGAKAVAAFEAADKAMGPRKSVAFHAARAGFLLALATDLAKAGRAAAARPYLDAAEAAVAKADAQASDPIPGVPADKQLFAKRYDERRLRGCVQEARAWVLKEAPAENFKKAVLALKLDRAPRTDVEFEGSVDLARCLIRGVRAGHLPEAQRLEAEGVLDRHLKALDDLAVELQRNPALARDLKASVERHRTRGEYWRSILFVHRAEAQLDDPNATPRAKADATKQLEDEADKLERLAKADPALEQTTAFVPDSLRGRVALKNNKAAVAAGHFRKAFDALARKTPAERPLRIDDTFAVKALVHELTGCYTFLTNTDRGRRKALLTDLERQYGWLLTDADRELLKTVSKLK